jgi:hypothetical protein
LNESLTPGVQLGAYRVEALIVGRQAEQSNLYRIPLP